MSLFQKATKAQAKLRMALVGPSGSGKTYWALSVASCLGGPIAVLDTEHGSASKYSDIFDFDTTSISDYDPRNYIKIIQMAEEAGYGVLILDSISHAYASKGGVLEIADKAGKRAGGNTFAGWKDATPIHQAFIEAILGSRIHIIATMRSHVEYIVQANAQTGRTAPVKMGTKPVQREGMDYEFDVIGNLDLDHLLTVEKTRCRHIDGQVFRHEGPASPLGGILKSWLSEGEPQAAAPAYRLRQDFADDLTRLFEQARTIGLFADHDEAIRNTLAARGVTRIDQLQEEEAATLIRKIEGKIEEQTYNPLPDPQPNVIVPETPAAGQEAVAASEATQEGGEPEPMTDEALGMDALARAASSPDGPEVIAAVEELEAGNFTIPDVPRRPAPEKPKPRARKKDEPAAGPDPEPAEATAEVATVS